MMKKFLLTLPVLFCLQVSAQKKTDASLFMKKGNAEQQKEITSETGDLYSSIGHHGPAVENQWLGLRIYFSNKVAIDLYSKEKPGLELKEAQWYPTEEQQKNGWGADYYKVGSTIGLGSVRLWDGSEAHMLDPVSMRTARVFSDADSSSMDMLSVGIPWKNKTVDILLRVTVYNEHREAKVEAFSLNGEEVQFVTGINYHKETSLDKGKEYIASWGIHPEDVAAEIVEIGGAIIYNSEDYVEQIDQGDQYLLISKPATYLKTWITGANARESEINTREYFVQYLEQIGK